MKPRDISATLLCGSEDGHTSVNSNQVLSDEDLPTAAGLSNLSPVEWYFRRSVSVGHPKNSTDERMQHSACVQSSAPEVRPKADIQNFSADGPSPVVGSVDIPEVGRVETIQLSSPPRSGQLSPESPQTVAFGDMGDSSVPLSPNCVQAEEIPEDGSLFDVSPVSPGFLMRPSGAAVRQPDAGLPLPLALKSFSDPFLGSPFAFAQCAAHPGSDSPMTLPVYALPSCAAYMMGQSSVQTVLASGASPRPEQLSNGMGRMEDSTREGPFDAFAFRMDTEDSPLITTVLSGCPHRIISFNGRCTRLRCPRLDCPPASMPKHDVPKQCSLQFERLFAKTVEPAV